MTSKDPGRPLPPDRTEGPTVLNGLGSSSKRVPTHGVRDPSPQHSTSTAHHRLEVLKPAGGHPNPPLLTVPEFCPRPGSVPVREPTCLELPFCRPPCYVVGYFSTHVFIRVETKISAPSTTPCVSHTSLRAKSGSTPRVGLTVHGTRPGVETPPHRPCPWTQGKAWDSWLEEGSDILQSPVGVLFPQ